MHLWDFFTFRFLFDNLLLVLCIFSDKAPNKSQYPFKSSRQSNSLIDPHPFWICIGQ